MSSLSFLHFNMLTKMHVMEKTAVGFKVQEGNEKMKDRKKKERGNPAFKLGNNSQVQSKIMKCNCLYVGLVNILFKLNISKLTVQSVQENNKFVYNTYISSKFFTFSYLP